MEDKEIPEELMSETIRWGVEYFDLLNAWKKPTPIFDYLMKQVEDD